MEADSLKADNKKIWIRGQFVEVTDEVYAAYMKGDRKIRYFENDLKTGRTVKDKDGNIKQGDMIVEEQEVRRGEIYHADLNPVFGSEQGGYRPVLIIQNNRGNRHSPTVIVAAITSRPKAKLPTHVPINGIKGLEKESFVLLEQIRTLDKGRLDDYIGRLNREQMIKVDKALRTSMEIKKLDKPILMCLCPVCAKPFYNSKEHFIIRADQDQTIKETCMFCNVRQGYDYLIRKKYY